MILALAVGANSGEAEVLVGMAVLESTGYTDRTEVMAGMGIVESDLSVAFCDISSSTY